MIQVTRLNGTKLFVNAEMIRLVEGTPDSVISLIDNSKIIVKETPQEVIARIIAYQQTVRQPLSNKDGSE